MFPQRAVLTYQDYLELPDDGRQYEIVDGDVFVNPAPNIDHQRTNRSLYGDVWGYVEGHHLGEVFFAPVDVVLSETNVIQPDIVYVANDRLDVIREAGIVGAPTLVVEIISPKRASRDRLVKRQLYERFGVPYYWIADRETRTIEAFELRGERYVLAATLEGRTPRALPPLPGLVLDPARVWR
ncbi:MAG: Uma2 family endonuclease [Chloroflexota bacterium]